MIRDTFRKTGKATSVFFNLFFFFLKVILLQMLTRREQDDGYVTLNAGKVNLLCSQSSLVSQILTPGAHLSRETFWEDSQLRSQSI